MKPLDVQTLVGAYHVGQSAEHEILQRCAHIVKLAHSVLQARSEEWESFNDLGDWDELRMEPFSLYEHVDSITIGVVIRVTTSETFRGESDYRRWDMPSDWLSSDDVALRQELTWMLDNILAGKKRDKEAAEKAAEQERRAQFDQLKREFES